MGTDSIGEFNFDPRGTDGIELGVIGDRNDAEVAAAEDPTGNSTDDSKAFNADDPKTTSVSDIEPTSRLTSSEDPSVASDDEDLLDEVQQTEKAKKAKKKAKEKVCPDPPGSSLSNEKSLRRLRKKCGISEEIVLVAPSPADRVVAPAPGHFTLFENYFDQCRLWFPLPRFLMRFLAAHGVCLAQINPKDIRHLINIYVLSRECGVDISTEHLSYLMDFRVHGRSDELKHRVTNASGMTLIAGFPSKDDHFEDRFFFVELSEKTVEADCAGLPSLPAVSKKFVTAMHDEVSSRNGKWRKSFSRKRIERALSTEIIPGKILGRGRARVSSREQAALDAAAKATRSLGSDARRVVRVDIYPPAVVDKEALASGDAVPSVSGLLRDEAYAATKSKAYEIKKDCDAKLAKLKLKCTKGDEEIASLKTQLSFASDLQSYRINEAVTEARDEMPRGFAGRVSQRRRPIYDARDVFGELLDSVREVLEIPEVSAADEVDDEADDEEP
ncbi:hypothetical protein AALP_AA1G342800 [Arabis alpina]|uniref:Uncharacterized protein n=1 Tax=Arabis alpina TaxID=50452 RepID=A0A087HSJ1_ARAAL|nr:hypothetical protein AALP_AA1G342800 [Arabis alpina]